MNEVFRWIDPDTRFLCDSSSLIAAGISAAGAVAGGVLASNAASTAASGQVAAANTAADASNSQYQQTRTDLAPYNALGQQAGGQLSSQLSSLTQPFSMTQAQLEQTPGYQFNLTQGEQAVQNSASARGLGVSGAAMKGAANYASGLADNTYQNQFNNYQTNQNNAFNKLLAVTGVGQSAAAQTGSFGQTAVQNANSALTTGAAATAAGNVGSANAISGSLTNVGNSLMNANTLNQLIASNTAKNNPTGSGY